MWQLNLPTYNFNIKKNKDKLLILDLQRKRFVTLTPEEWVRQNFIQFLIHDKNYPGALIAVESQLEINGMKKRCDAIIYNRDGHPLIIVEFKSPSIPITQKTFDQAAVYNSKLNVTFFIISNGLEHYFCRIDKQKMSYDFFSEIPDFTFFYPQI